MQWVMPILENKKHEAFANATARGETVSAAYSKAYDVKPGNGANASGQKLLRRATIQARIDELQTPSQQKLEAGTIADLAEIQTFLTNVMRTPVGDVTEKSPLCQSWKVITTEFGGSTEYKMPDKVRAAELLGRFSGLLRDKPDVSVTVAIITQEQAAARVKRVLPYVERVSLRQVNP